MATGYDDIDNLTNQTNQLYDEQMKQQESIVNTSTQQIIDEIERNKQKAQEQATKTNRALYTDYQKQINPYGVNAENLAEQGLAGSGLTESTKANYYNTYQNARTEATNNANTIKADFDAEIARARQNGDLQLAQSALEMYQQKVQDLYNTYNLKFQQDQFNYTKEQDALAQSNWEKEYQQALQQAEWERAFNQSQFDYQKERDAVSDSQWEKEYQLAKKNATASRKSSGKTTTLNVTDRNNVNTGNVPQTTNGTSNSNSKFNITEYAFDKKISDVISSTQANSNERSRILNGEYKLGNITKEEYNYLMNVQ